MSVDECAVDEVFAVEEIAAPSLADILSRLLGEQSDNFEFSKGQADRLSGLQRPRGVEAQSELAEPEPFRSRRIRVGGGPPAFGDQLVEASLLCPVARGA